MNCNQIVLTLVMDKEVTLTPIKNLGLSLLIQG